ncbi:MAG: hypothetical protein QGE95_15505, partial [Arenicellales bacterium]|nr:hypothetical protein [Arenicellales bacterium]
FTVGSGTTVTGRAMWNDQALPSASVIAVPEGNSYTDPNPAATGSVDADGYFTISFTGAGNHMIWVMGPPGEYWGIGRKVTPSAGETVDLGNFYVVKKMVLLTPENSSTVTTMPTFSWEAFPGAVDYHLDVFNSTGEPVLSVDVGEATEYAVETGLILGEKYQWSVYAESKLGIRIAHYSSFYFTVGSGTTVTGRAMWNDQALPSVSVIAVPEGTSRYTTNPAATGSVDADGYFTISFIGTGTHMIWVMGLLDEYQGIGKPVEPDPGATVDLGNTYVAKKMTVPTIEYVLLPNGVDHRFEFSWEAFPDAVDYRVAIWNTSTDPSTEMFQDSVGNVTKYTFESSLSLDTEYQFSVTAISGVKEPGSSAGIQFAYYSGLNFAMP